MEVIIRGLTINDIDQVIEIEKQCFSMPWSKEAFENELKNILAYYQCAEVNGRLVGYMGMWKIIDECHITNVAVLPEYRNLGIATSLINKMIEICKCSEIVSMTLEVRETNYQAIKLYSKFGFKAVGIRPKYYQLPTENAIIMWKEI